MILPRIFSVIELRDLYYAKQGNFLREFIEVCDGFVIRPEKELAKELLK